MACVTTATIFRGVSAGGVPLGLALGPLQVFAIWFRCGFSFRLSTIFICLFIFVFEMDVFFFPGLVYIFFFCVCVFYFKFGTRRIDTVERTRFVKSSLGKQRLTDLPL